MLTSQDIKKILKNNFNKEERNMLSSLYYGYDSIGNFWFIRHGEIQNGIMMTGWSRYKVSNLVNKYLKLLDEETKKLNV